MGLFHYLLIRNGGPYVKYQFYFSVPPVGRYIVLIFVALVALVALVADVILYQNQFTK